MPEHVSLADLTGKPHARALAGPPRAVRLSLDAGESLPAHRHPESHVLVHLFEGGLDRRLDGESYATAPGDLVQFDGDRRVEPRSETDSVALVVFAPKRGWRPATQVRFGRLTLSRASRSTPARPAAEPGGRWRPRPSGSLPYRSTHSSTWTRVT